MKTRFSVFARAQVPTELVEHKTTNKQIQLAFFFISGASLTESHTLNKRKDASSTHQTYPTTVRVAAEQQVTGEQPCSPRPSPKVSDWPGSRVLLPRLSR